MIKEKKKLNNAEIKAILKPYNEDIKRHMGALKEHFEHNVKAIGEQYFDLKKDIKRIDGKLDSHTEMIGKIAVDVETLKEDIKVVKEDVTVLKQDMKMVKEDIVILKDDMVVVKSDLQIIKTDVEPRVAHLEARSASRN